MADTTNSGFKGSGWRPDPVWLLMLAIPLAVWIVDPQQLRLMLEETASSFGHTSIFIALAVLAIAYLKASGAATMLARVFEGNEVRMIFFAAAFGGLSPFCSCEVIPFVAALLAVGAPLSAVMAFWLASPLMDPAMFFVTSGALGLDFAIAKTVAAVVIGAGGGFAVRALANTALYANPLKEQPAKSGCGCGPSPFEGKPNWTFWHEPERSRTFRDTAVENALFLSKWLLFAYMLQSLMITYVPAEWIGGFLGGDGAKPIIIGALIGAPAYLNGYAAVPLIAGLLEQGMSPGAAMSFVIAGGISCIPAAVAVWALVKPRVFASYLIFALTGALLAGFVWGAVA